MASNTLFKRTSVRAVLHVYYIKTLFTYQSPNFSKLNLDFMDKKNKTIINYYN